MTLLDNTDRLGCQTFEVMLDLLGGKLIATQKIESWAIEALAADIDSETVRELSGATSRDPFWSHRRMMELLSDFGLTADQTSATKTENFAIRLFLRELMPFERLLDIGVWLDQLSSFESDYCWLLLSEDIYLSSCQVPHRLTAVEGNSPAEVEASLRQTLDYDLRERRKSPDFATPTA